MKVLGQLEAAQLENLVGAPANAPTGRVYADITTPTNTVPMFFNGSSWIPMTGGYGVTNLSSVSGSVTIDWSKGLNQKCVLGGFTVFAFTNWQEGGDHRLTIQQAQFSGSVKSPYDFRFPSDVDWGTNVPHLPKIDMNCSETFSFRRHTGITPAYISMSAVNPPFFAPAGAANSVSIDYTGRFLIVAETPSTYNELYQFNRGMIGSKFAGATLDGQTNDVKISPFRNIACFAENVSPYIKAVQFRDVGYGSNFTNPGTLPAGALVRLDMSPNELFVAGVGSTSPYVQVWPLSAQNGFGTIFSNPATLPAGAGTGVAWSPDGQYLAVSHTGSPYVSVYPMTSTAFGTKVSNPGVLPQGNGTAVAWSNNGQYLAVGCATNPYLTIYPFSAGVLGTAIVPVSAATCGSITSIAWSPQDDFILVTGGTSPYYAIFPFSAGVLSSPLQSSLGIAGAATTGIWSVDGRYVFFTSGTTPYFWVASAPYNQKNWTASKLAFDWV